MPLLLSRWCSQTLQKFHQRENYIKIILQTQTILTPHLRILYFSPHYFLHKRVEGYLRCLQRMQISQFSANFTIFIRCNNVLAKLHSFTKFQDINVEYKRVKSCQYRFLIKYEHFNHFEHFFPWSTFAAGGMCCIRCKQKCFVLAQKPVKEVTFVLLFQRERGWTSCLWRNDDCQEGVHWQEDQPLDHQLTRRVLLNLSLATDRLLTDGRWWLFTMDFRCLFLHKRINFLSRINLPPFVPLWVINENEEAIRSEEPLISLDLLWIRNLWPCVIYITLVTCFSHNFLHKEIPSHISYGGL